MQVLYFFFNTFKILKHIYDKKKYKNLYFKEIKYLVINKSENSSFSTFT